MQERHLYEYAVLRIVPQVEREEFFNVGVILYCKDLKFLGVKFHLNESRLSCFGLIEKAVEFEQYLDSFRKIASGQSDGGPIAQFPVAERFRWLTAARSTVIQSSSIHPGLTTDPEAKLEQLFQELVG